MADKADVIVVGGGVNGLSVAYHLAKARAGRIVLVEREHFAAGATGKSGALVRTHYTNEPETRLAHESLKVFAHWDDVIGGDCGFSAVGLMVLVPERLRSTLEANVAMHRSLGVDARLLSPAEAQAMDPSLWLGDIGAVAYEPESGYADPNLTAYAFARAAAREGVEHRLDTQVTQVMTQAGRVTGVRTSQGDIEAPVVVVAAGVRANALFHPLGIDLGLRPCAARVVLFRPAYEQSIGNRTYIDYTYGSWFRPDGTRTLVGAEVGNDPDTNPDANPEHVSQAYIAFCHQQMVKRFPGMRHSSTRGNWQGAIMLSPDSRPLIGALPAYEGLYCVAGDSGTSFKTSPAIGLCLTELITEGRAHTVDLTPFRPSRIAEGALWRDENDYEIETPTISR